MGCRIVFQRKPARLKLRHERTVHNLGLQVLEQLGFIVTPAQFENLVDFHFEFDICVAVLCRLLHFLRSGLWLKYLWVFRFRRWLTDDLLDYFPTVHRWLALARLDRTLNWLRLRLPAYVELSLELSVVILTSLLADSLSQPFDLDRCVKFPLVSLVQKRRLTRRV